MRAIQRIQFTDAEREQLAASMSKGAVAIAEIWDILREIEKRVGFDWEPSRTSVAEILEYFAVSIDDPAAAEQCVSPDNAVAAFSRPKDWIVRS
jgi:hypothetical protein